MVRTHQLTQKESILIEFIRWAFGDPRKVFSLKGAFGNPFK